MFVMLVSLWEVLFSPLKQLFLPSAQLLDPDLGYYNFKARPGVFLKENINVFTV